MFLELRTGLNAKAAIILADDIKKLYAQLLLLIKQLNNVVAIRENCKRKKQPQLKRGDKVYLLTKNIKARRLNKKLDYVKVGLFLIKEEKGPVNYRLALLQDAKVHLVFYVSLLELADNRTPLQTTFYYNTKEETEYKVERILKRKGQNYLVKQKGYNKSESTQELIYNLSNCKEIVQQYYRIEKL